MFDVSGKGLCKIACTLVKQASAVTGASFGARGNRAAGAANGSLTCGSQSTHLSTQQSHAEFHTKKGLFRCGRPSRQYGAHYTTEFTWQARRLVPITALWLDNSAPARSLSHDPTCPLNSSHFCTNDALQISLRLIQSAYSYSLSGKPTWLLFFYRAVFAEIVRVASGKLSAQSA